MIRGAKKLMIAVCCVLVSTTIFAQNINTIAGIGSSSFSGDGGLATSAELAQPVSVARDGSGNVYISDQGNHRIRKINYSTGIISTIAGSSTAGFSGDGGAATSAQLYYPSGIAIDGSGNIYIADQANQRIRKVTASTGVITTIAGTGTAGFSGDGAAATSAQLNNPVGVAIDGSGNVYIADQYNQRIRKITISTGNISTIAGTGTYSYSGDGAAASAATFQNPAGIKIDASGNIFIADLFNHVIRKITASTGIISTVAGTGTAGFSGDGAAATSATLNYPTDIAVDDSGNIFIAVQYSHRIRKVSAATGYISTFAGTGTAGYSGDGGPSTLAQINYPTGIASDGGGNLYIADRENHRIRFVCNYLVKPTVSTPVSYCVGSTAVALTATGSSLKWFTTRLGGTGSTTAPTPSTASAGSTTYYVASISPYGCEGPRDSIAVTVNALPSAPTVTTPVSYCVGATASPISATGTSLKWYTSATGGTGSTTAPTPGTTIAGTTYYYVSQTSSSTGCESPRSTITVVINSLPSAPLATTSITYCEGVTASALTATGTSLLWYTSATGGTGSAIAPTPSTSTAGTTVYYVSQTTSCGESSRTAITVTVNAKPSIPTVTSPVSYCQYATAIALTATGTSLKWYTSATGGTGSTTAPIPSTSSAGTLTYYVSQTSASFGCESDRASIVVNITAAPSVPTVTSPVVYCLGATASTLTASGTSLLWYTVATGGTGSATAPTPSTATTGTTTYYVSQTSGTSGCESGRIAIVVTVNPLPTAPTVTTPINYCMGSSAVALTATGTSLLWYTSATGGSGSSTAPTPSTATVGTTTYYVSQTTSCGESSRSAIVVTINPVPSAPTVTSPIVYCQGDTSVPLTASGTSLKWYTSATGGTGSSTAPTPSTASAGSTTYYVSSTNSYGCESSRSAIVVNVKAAPLPPIVTTPINYCVGATASALTATGTGLLWYTSATGGVGSSTAPTPSTATAGSVTYYVGQTDTSSCRSLRAAITVNVYAPPSVPTVSTPVNYCVGATTSILTATPVSSTDTLKWYASATGGVASLTAPTPSSATATTTTYYVSATSKYGCGESTRSGIVVNINANPSTPGIVSPVNYCIGDVALSLSATGTSLKWYNTATGGVGTSTAPTPSTSVAGTLKYYVSQTNVAGCEGARDSIIVTINALPTAPSVSSPVIYCVGSSAIPLSATGTSLKWYATATGGASSTTAPTPITTSAGTTIYYVSQTNTAGCEGPRTAIVVNVSATTSAPIGTTPITYCQGATAAALTATGTSLLWYTTATGGTGTSTAPTPSTSSSGTTTYYVSQTISTGGCGESSRTAIDVNVNPTPPAPTVSASAISYCTGATASVLSATGTSLLWYTSATGGSSVSTAPTPSTSTSGITNYYVSQTNTFGCESSRTSIAVTINSTPAAPVVTSPVEYCSGSTAVALSAGGSTLKWYTSATGGTSSSIAPTPSTASTGATSYYVSQTSAVGCESPRAAISVIVYATPSAPTVGFLVTLCLGGAASPLTATGSGLKWYTSATGGTGSTTAPTPSTSSTGAAYYYVSQSSSSGCEGPRAAILVNIDTLLGVPTVTTPVVYCQADIATPLVASGTSLHWYTGSITGTYSTTAPTPSTTSAGTTKYYVCRVSSAGCEGTKDSITVTINPLPTLPTVTTPVSYCLGATAAALSATGLSLKWYTSATGGTASTTAPIPSTATAGTTTYYVSQTTALGCEGSRASIVVSINSLPAAPTVSTPVTYCQGATATALSATGTSLLWYTTATGGTGSTTAPTPSTSVAGSTTYYVSQSSGTCEGPRASIIVTINPLPTTPSITTPASYCQGATATALTATGTSLKWYTVATGGTGSSTAPIPSTTTAGSTKYYVSQTSTLGCEGARDSITVTINPLPTLPTVTTPVSYCLGATAAALSATGSSLKWYTSATGGTASTTAPIPSTATAGTTTYYVSQTTALGCEGSRASIVVTINSLPAAPTVSTPVTYCQGATATALSATGTSLLWYTTATGGTGSTTVPTPSTSVAGSTTYYVSQSSGTCEGPRASIIVTINPLPTTPSITTPVSYCQGATATALTATGTSLKWYTVATGGTGSSTAPIPSTTTAGSTKYYVSQTSTLGCEGARDSITVTINALPTAPTVTTPVNYCQGVGAAPALSAIGSSLKWYTSATGGTASTTAPTPSLTTAGTTTYYVSQTTTLGCEGSRASIVVNIYATPAAPTVTTPVTYCQFATATALTATGSSLKWYPTATGSTGFYTTTAPTPSTATAGTTGYYVSQTSVDGCESPRAEIDVVVNPAPAAPTIITPIAYCQFAIATPLTATGSSLKWYSTATGGTGSSTAPTPITTTPGSTIYYVSQTSTAGCEGVRAALTVVVNLSSTKPTVVSPVGYCLGATAVPLSATGISLRWYTSATGGTGSTTAPTPSTATVGSTTYYVTQTSLIDCESPRESIVVIVSNKPTVSIIPSGASRLVYCKDDSVTLKASSSVTLSNYQWYRNGTLLYGDTTDTYHAYSNGYYKVVVKNASGCQNDTTVYVYADTLALPTLSPIKLNFCPNVSIILFCKPASYDYTYEWYKDSVLIGGASKDQLVINKAGDYYVRVTDSLGCVTITNTSSAFTYPPILRPTIIRADPVLRLNRTYLTYQWYRNNKSIAGANAINYTMPFTGKYYCQVTDDNGCSEVSDTVDTETINSIGSTELNQHNIKIYPNPTKNKVFIEAPMVVNVLITDITGRLIWKQEQVKEVDLEPFADGMYLFTITDDEGNLLLKDKINKLSTER
jgi:hypothetical protein